MTEIISHCNMCLILCLKYFQINENANPPAMLGRIV